MNIENYKKENPELYHTVIPKDDLGIFSNLGVEEDTKILSRELVKVGTFKALLEHWSWEGVQATSIIFDANNVKEMTEREIKTLVIDSGYCHNPKPPTRSPEDQELFNDLKEKGYLKDEDLTMTLSRKEDFVFVNFDFQY